MVFFGALTLAVLFSGSGKTPLFGNWMFKGGALLFFLGGVAFLYFTLLQLKRVEIDHDHVYVTNFFKSYRYPFANVRQIVERNFILFHIATIELYQPGSFGRKIHFMESRQKFDDFVKSYPELADKLIVEEWVLAY